MSAPQHYAPEFALALGGAPIPAGLRASITSVRYEDGVPSMATAQDDDGLDAADRVEIEIANVDLRWLARHVRGLGFRPVPGDLKLGPLRLGGDEPDGLFDIDNKVSLDMGYASAGMERMFEGEITGVEADFPGSGMPLLRVVAHDYLHRLAGGRYARGFSPFIPDWLVAAILGAENLLLPLIDPVVGAASSAMTVLNAIFGGGGRAQRGSDLDLLKQIAATYDADFWVEGDVLYLSRVLGKEFEPRLTLAWGESLLSFAPRVSTVGQVIGVAVKFSLPLLPISFLMTVSWDFEREALVVRVIPGAAAVAMKSLMGGPSLSVISRKLQTPGDIANSALAITRLLRNKLNNRLTASGATVGDPRIRAGAVVRIDGVGPDFSGNYRITGATHTIDGSGYRTAFKARKEILP